MLRNLIGPARARSVTVPMNSDLLPRRMIDRDWTTQTKESPPCPPVTGPRFDHPAGPTCRRRTLREVGPSTVRSAQEANPDLVVISCSLGMVCVPVAGAMGDMGDMRATDTWKSYLNTDDLTKTLATASEQGAGVTLPPMEVADLGTQAVLTDPTGAQLGAWEPKTFEGFTVLGQHGAPSWFELFARDFHAAVSFYGSVFRWETEVVRDSDQFRYAQMQNPDETESWPALWTPRSCPKGCPRIGRFTGRWATLRPSLPPSLGWGVQLSSRWKKHRTAASPPVTDPSGAQFKLRQQSTSRRGRRVAAPVARSGQRPGRAMARLPLRGRRCVRPARAANRGVRA